MEENWFDEVNPEEFDQVKKEEKKPSENAGSILSVIENIQKKKLEKNTVYRSRRAEEIEKVDMLEDMPTLEETKQAELDAMDADSAFEDGIMDIPDDFDPLGEEDSYDGETYIMEDEGQDAESDQPDPEPEENLQDIPDEAETPDEDADNNAVEQPVENASDEEADTEETEPEVEFNAEFSVEETRRILSGKTSFKANKRDLVKVVKEENFISIEVLDGGIIKGDYIGAEENVTISQNATAMGDIEGYLVTVLGTVKGNVTGNIVIVKGNVEGNITAKECVIGGHRVVLEKETLFENYEG